MLGVGNEMNADDGAGPALARSLTRRLARLAVLPGLLVIDAGLAPENFTGPLRRFAPDLLVLVDAADFSQASKRAMPGAAACLDFDDLDGFSASTHLAPLSLFRLFVTRELGCEVLLLGIQPAGTGPGRGLSPPVRRCVNRLARFFMNIMAGMDNIR